MTPEEWKRIIEVSYEWYETEVKRKTPPIIKPSTPIPPPTPEDIEMLKQLLTRIGWIK